MTDTKPVHRRPPFVLGFLLVAVLALGLIVPLGSGAYVELANETVSVDADTSTAWAEFTNNNETTAANVSATFYAVNNSTETNLGTQNVTVAANGTELIESTAINGTANDSVRIVAELDNSTVPKSNLTVTTGTFQKTTGGAGIGGTSGTEIGIGALAVVAVVAVLFLGGRDD